MKIELQSQIPVYRKNSGKEQSAQASSIPAESRRDTDVMDIGYGSITADKQLSSLKASVQGHVSAPADPDRLAGLRASIREGEYHIPTNQIVDSILGEW